MEGPLRAAVCALGGGGGRGGDASASAAAARTLSEALRARADAALGGRARRALRAYLTAAAGAGGGVVLDADSGVLRLVGAAESGGGGGGGGDGGMHIPSGGGAGWTLGGALRLSRIPPAPALSGAAPMSRASLWAAAARLGLSAGRVTPRALMVMCEALEDTAA